MAGENHVIYGPISVLLRIFSNSGVMLHLYSRQRCIYPRLKE